MRGTWTSPPWKNLAECFAGFAETLVHSKIHTDSFIKHSSQLREQFNSLKQVFDPCFGVPVLTHSEVVRAVLRSGTVSVSGS